MTGRSTFSQIFRSTITRRWEKENNSEIYFRWLDGCLVVSIVCYRHLTSTFIDQWWLLVVDDERNVGGFRPFQMRQGSLWKWNPYPYRCFGKERLVESKRRFTSRVEKFAGKLIFKLSRWYVLNLSNRRNYCHNKTSVHYMKITPMKQLAKTRSKLRIRRPTKENHHKSPQLLLLS